MIGRVVSIKRDFTLDWTISVVKSDQKLVKNGLLCGFILLNLHKFYMKA